ncbi:hypothetical protein HanIR_Chr11g0560341 [Helianthus annuus]|nr:hypothetical protein HanIR_Chr11g0560341 [Helianthus annuus]
MPKLPSLVLYKRVRLRQGLVYGDGNEGITFIPNRSVWLKGLAFKCRQYTHNHFW